MSRFHAMFSLGGIAGAAAGGLIAAQLIPPLAHFLIAAAIFLTFSLWTAPLIMEERFAVPTPASVPPRLQIRRLPVALLIGAIGFCIFLSEGAIADWTAIYLKQVLGAGPGLAAQATLFSLPAMAVFRLFGDSITARFGPAWTIRAGGILAACGLTSALLVHSPYWALPGFALAGAAFLHHSAGVRRGWPDQVS